MDQQLNQPQQAPDEKVFKWTLFAESCQGGSHAERSTPCQDSSSKHPGSRIIAVADGHGNRRHFRSETGSALGCAAAESVLTDFIEQYGSGGLNDDLLHQLKQNILTKWSMLVTDHWHANPWTDEEWAEQCARLTDEELARLENGADVLYPYGSTLIAAAVTKKWWLAVQIGDGEAAVLDHNGCFSWPMPESSVNQGSRTASLCMDDPMPEFRHVYGHNLPAGVIIYTDGIEKAFPAHGQALTNFLFKLWLLNRKAAGHPHLSTKLQEGLQMVANTSSVKDDVSAAGLIDATSTVEALNNEKLILEEQRRQDINSLKECASTIAFNKDRLARIRRERGSADAAAQIESILQRKIAQRNELMERLHLSAADLDAMMYSETNRIPSSLERAVQRMGLMGRAAAGQMIAARSSMLDDDDSAPYQSRRAKAAGPLPEPADAVMPQSAPASIPQTKVEAKETPPSPAPQPDGEASGAAAAVSEPAAVPVSPDMEPMELDDAQMDAAFHQVQQYSKCRMITSMTATGTSRQIQVYLPGTQEWLDMYVAVPGSRKSK